VVLVEGAPAGDPAGSTARHAAPTGDSGNGMRAAPTDRDGLGKGVGTATAWRGVRGKAFETSALQTLRAAGTGQCVAERLEWAWPVRLGLPRSAGFQTCCIAGLRACCPHPRQPVPLSALSSQLSPSQSASDSQPSTLNPQLPPVGTQSPASPLVGRAVPSAPPTGQLPEDTTLRRAGDSAPYLRSEMSLPPISTPERLGAVLLIGIALLIGLWPRLLLDLIGPSFGLPYFDWLRAGGVP
jgi:hypothetical protein